MQELDHGVAFTTAGVTAEPLDEVLEAVVAAPAGLDGVAPPSGVAPAGSTYAVALIVPVSRGDLDLLEAVVLRPHRCWEQG